MRIDKLIVTLAMSVLGAGAVNAAEICKAKTFQKYGETRAFFQDVIAGCDKAKNCYAATHVADNGQGYAYRQQIRVRRNAGEPTNRLFFVGVDPMPAAKGQFSISVDDKAWTLSTETALTPQSGNEFELFDLKVADQMVAMIRGGKEVAWLYPTENGGAHVARFGVRGMNDALKWTTCMQTQK
jgi:hypothetical protein